MGGREKEGSKAKVTVLADKGQLVWRGRK